MTKSFPPEVVRLAKLRFDREHGEGAWKAFMKYASSESKADDIRRVRRICKEVLRRAEQDFIDLKSVMKIH